MWGINISDKETKTNIILDSWYTSSQVNNISIEVNALYCMLSTTKFQFLNFIETFLIYPLHSYYTTGLKLQQLTVLQIQEDMTYRNGEDRRELEDERRQYYLEDIGRAAI